MSEDRILSKDPSDLYVWYKNDSLHGVSQINDAEMIDDENIDINDGVDDGVNIQNGDFEDGVESINNERVYNNEFVIENDEFDINDFADIPNEQKEAYMPPIVVQLDADSIGINGAEKDANSWKLIAFVMGAIAVFELITILALAALSAIMVGSINQTQQPIYYELPVYVEPNDSSAVLSDNAESASAFGGDESNSNASENDDSVKTNSGVIKVG